MLTLWNVLWLPFCFVSYISHHSHSSVICHSSQESKKIKTGLKIEIIHVLAFIYANDDLKLTHRHGFLHAQCLTVEEKIKMRILMNAYKNVHGINFQLQKFPEPNRILRFMSYKCYAKELHIFIHFLLWRRRRSIRRFLKFARSLFPMANVSRAHFFKTIEKIP